VNFSVIAEHLTPFNEAFRLPSVAGAWNIENTHGLAVLGGEIERQASMIGYINAFYLFSAAAVSVIPLIFLLRRPAPAPR
jgi:DHA2 family multidrug resistance protein